MGGGAGSGNFPIMAADEDARRRFVLGIRDYLGAHCLDGVDIDWERWTKDGNNVPVASEKANLVALLERYGGIDYTKRLAVTHIKAAKERIQSFGKTPTAEILQDIADYALVRKV